ncbi:hypothetical protein B0I35DRAFT_406454 [Stachybotrys elegans]|uniref:Uncharacterized protein n=1 Tax=Stachybotrys elegans TaxID=80388 RepID=A0A8K0SWH4_9HYPO|nr:hypothetical protein B0I35DRAFT_406454 [Stachybotrys elegans]
MSDRTIERLGVSCPARSRFYVCPDSGFVGCCATDACAEPDGRCPQDRMEATSFDQYSYNMIEPQTCFDSDAQWFTCAATNPPFFGCCTINPCATGSCPLRSLRAAKLSDDREASAVFLDGLDTDSGLDGGAIAGIVIGVLAAVILIAGAVFWWLMRRKIVATDDHHAQINENLPAEVYGSGHEPSVYIPDKPPTVYSPTQTGLAAQSPYYQANISPPVPPVPSPASPYANNGGVMSPGSISSPTIGYKEMAMMAAELPATSESDRRGSNTGASMVSREQSKRTLRASYVSGVSSSAPMPEPWQPPVAELESAPVPAPPPVTRTTPAPPRIPLPRTPAPSPPAKDGRYQGHNDRSNMF